MDRLPPKRSMTLPKLMLNVYSLYTLSNSRQNFDLKYQMPKHNMYDNLRFFAQKLSSLFAKTIAVGKGLKRLLRAQLTILSQGSVAGCPKTTAVTFSGRSKQKTLPPLMGDF